MRRFDVCLSLLGMAAWTAFIAGCSGGVPTLDTEPVEGVVTLDGQPVAGATVTFVPVTQGQGMSATGITDGKGVYKLTAVATGSDVAAEPESGTLPGEYFVGVIKASVKPSTEGDEATAKTEKEIYAETEMTYIVPEKYKNPRKSGLKVTVQEGENNIPIELTGS